MPALYKKGILDSSRVLFLPVEAIAPNPDQPRRTFAQGELEELAASIREMGLLQPLTVRRRESGWELVAGERRLRAAKLAGLTEVPCLSLQVDGAASSLLALVENLQRKDLDFWEEALVEQLLHPEAPAPPARRPRRIFVVKDVRLFLNSLDRGMALMRSAGVDAQCRREDRDGEILLTIHIPRSAPPHVSRETS